MPSLVLKMLEAVAPFTASKGKFVVVSGGKIVSSYKVRKNAVAHAKRVGADDSRAFVYDDIGNFIYKHPPKPPKPV